MLNTFGDARGLFDDLRISEFAGQAPVHGCDDFFRPRLGHNPN
jgi:hypothetical protein